VRLELQPGGGDAFDDKFLYEQINHDRGNRCDGGGRHQGSEAYPVRIFEVVGAAVASN